MFNTSKRRTFLTLDGLRGLAAILIVYHHQRTLGMSNAPGGAYVAVDLFFLMSGFVIAHAYDERLKAGMAPMAFLRRRLIRLYPLYILGTGLGLVVLAAFGHLTPAHPTNPLELLRLAGSAVLMAPTLTTDPTVLAFPLNPPAWSLFFELLINLVYATVAIRFSTRTLALICALSAALLALWGWQTGTLNLGFQTHSILVGVPRVSFSFFGGVILYRLYRSGRLPRLRLHPLWGVLGAMALLTFPIHGEQGWFWTLALVLFGFPALLVLCVGSREPGPRVGQAFALSGELSYPLYALHEPLVIGLMMSSRFWNWPVSMLEPGIGLIMGPALALAALAVSRAYDRPIAAWLTRLNARAAEPARIRPAASGAEAPQA